MNYSWDSLGGSPFRKVHTDPSRNLSRNPGFSVSGFRTQSWSRGTGSISSSYKRTNLSTARGYSSAAHRSSESVELSHSGLFNDDCKAVSVNEKELMQGLNDRFAGYIEKVRQLEQQNKGLEGEIVELRQKQTSPSCLANIYEPEIRELRNLIQEIENQKTQVHLDRDHLEEDLQQLKGKYEEEARIRDEVETNIRIFKKDRDDAHLIKLELEKKAQSLTDEIVFLKKNHEEEVADLFSQIQASQVSVEMKEFMKPDLTAALREIRAQMEGYTNDNMQQTEEWFRSKVAKLSEAAEINNEAIQSTRQEISEYRRQLQSKSIELETVRGTKESLEKQLNDIEERHDAELVQYQDTIQQLENEFKNTKWEMTHHLREYQDLLNVKMALDVEIASYRKLLEGEETRFGSITGSFTPPSYTYRQAQPIQAQYTRQAHSIYVTSKAKGTPTKIAPQYKFVEEIISETTKEVDMAELEDTDLRAISDDGSGEKFDEEDQTKQEEDEDKDEATTAEASDEEEAERTSETKEESAEEEAVDSKEVKKEETMETKEPEEKESAETKEESEVAETTETKAEEESTKTKETEELDAGETKEEVEEETAETKEGAEEEETTETKESEEQKAAETKDTGEEKVAERKDTEEQKATETKDTEEQKATETKDTEEQKATETKDTEEQKVAERKDTEEQKAAETKQGKEESTETKESEERETAETKAEAKEEEIADTKDEAESEEQAATEEDQTEPGAATDKRNTKEQDEDHVAQQKEESKGTITSQKDEPESAAEETAEESKDRKQLDKPEQESHKGKEMAKADEKEAASQKLPKESENQKLKVEKVQTSEETKVSEAPGQTEKSKEQSKEEKVEDKKSDIPKKEGKETNKDKEIPTLEEKKTDKDRDKKEDSKESEEKTAKASEAEKVEEKVASGSPESKSTQSVGKTSEAVTNDLDIKLDKEEKEGETDKKTTKASTEVIQKIAEESIKNKEERTKASVTSTVKKEVIEETKKEEKSVTASSDTKIDAKESK